MEAEMVLHEPKQIELVRPQGMAVDRPPQEVLVEATKAATALQDVISRKKKKVVMNGEQYLEFEDWQTLGHFYGVTAGEDGDPEPVTINEVHGFKASAVAYRHGQVISRATQYCMRDEEKWRARPKYEWKNGVKTQVGEEVVPTFQLSSMAQTRACAKVLRNVLAWVVVLAGYRPTPHEEMESLATIQPNGPTPVFAQNLRNLECNQPTTPAPQAQPLTAPPSKAVVGSAGESTGIVEKLAAKQSQRNGKPFMIFTFNGNSVTTWDTAIFPFLTAHEGKQIMAVIEHKGNYHNLIACRPVEPAETEITDEDIPF